MEYMGNEAYWNTKFKSRGEQSLPPDKMLIENISYFKKGTVLDIACGDGRNALYLLQKGFEVTGVDFSEEALERLIHFANQENLSVDTLKVDLSQKNALRTLGTFDNIVINHYRLSADLLGTLKNHVVKDGIVFVSGFGEKHKTDQRIREEDIIKKSDFILMENDFELIKCTESEEAHGCFVTYILKRNK